MRVSKNQIKDARVANLYGYLLMYHPETVKTSGVGRLRNVDHESLVITRGAGWIHNSTGQKGNAVDYLVNYLGYDFADAVLALSKFGGDDEDGYLVHNTLVYPDRADTCRNAFAYLRNRGISDKLLSELMHSGLIYQERNTNNICFVAENFVETHSSLSYKTYKGVVSGSDPDGYWAFGSGDKTKSICYVCESAIDAMSLYCIRQASGRTQPCYYASMAGLKQGTLNRIKSDFDTVILAVDNDDAGTKICCKNSLLLRKKPVKKDWNEDLQAIINE